MATETEMGLWRVVTSAAAAGVVAVAAWLVGLASRQREMQSWRKGVDEHIKKCEAATTGTHDAVLIMQTNVEHLTADVEEIKKGQGTILDRLADLLRRPSA